MRHQTVRLLAGGAAALLFSAVLLAQANERVVYVSAWDKETRAPITGLGVDAFTVREDGRAREVLRVSPASSPMPIAILVDNSQAARDHIADIRKSLTSFVRAACELSTRIAIGIGEVAAVTRSTSRRAPSSRTEIASTPRPVMGARVF